MGYEIPYALEPKTRLGALQRELLLKAFRRRAALPVVKLGSAHANSRRRAARRLAEKGLVEMLYQPRLIKVPRDRGKYGGHMMRGSQPLLHIRITWIGRLVAERFSKELLGHGKLRWAKLPLIER